MDVDKVQEPEDPEKPEFKPNPRSSKSKKLSSTISSKGFDEIVVEAEMLTKEQLARFAYNLEDGEYGGMIRLIAFRRSTGTGHLSSFINMHNPEF